MGIISWIILGLITGWIASKIADKTGSGMMMDIALGVIGAIVSGFSASFRVAGDNISISIIAAIGAVVVLLVYDVVGASLPKVDAGFVQFVSNLTGGILGQANPACPSDVPDPRSDIDAVAHQTAVGHQAAVGLFDHIAQMNADPKFDATVLRHARVALDHRVLYLRRAAHSEDHAAKRDDRAVAVSGLPDAICRLRV
jgi:uncharacterized membrane protein YeaQ/YmgE (transglycosylase-associated protein family)